MADKWDELKKTESYAKWDNWDARPKRKPLPLLNYASAIVFGLATLVEASGTMI